MENFINQTTNMTVGLCIQLCKANESTYAGLRVGGSSYVLHIFVCLHRPCVIQGARNLYDVMNYKVTPWLDTPHVLLPIKIQNNKQLIVILSSNTGLILICGTVCQLYTLQDNEQKHKFYCFASGFNALPQYIFSNPVIIYTTFLSIQHGAECLCGDEDDYNKTGNVSDEECNEPCEGDDQTMCGGRESIMVYAGEHLQ